MQNGTALQTLYRQIDTAAEEFHNDTSKDADAEGIIANFDYMELGLSLEEAISVWVTYKADHPLYYWMSSSFAYTPTHLYFYTAAEYTDGDVRAAYNKLVYDAILEMRVTEQSTYMYVLTYHDAIINRIDYAYEADGVTPEDDVWAHSILGIFDNHTGVCEAYAKTFQLLLNYSGVENLLVTGDAGGPHAWNMVHMDDGNWYWFDLTWDDTPDIALGISYDYFCVNDSEGENSSFTESHTPDTPEAEGLAFQYALPARSAKEYARPDGLGLGDAFRADGFSCIIVGKDAVEITGVDGEGKIAIPAEIVYGGVTYEVIALGDSANNTTIIKPTVTEVTIPETVKFIEQNALSYSAGALTGLQNIFVHPDNPYFTSKDGVLFTKSLYTLIQYPSANERTEYRVPDETAIIAYNALAYCRNLSSLTLGAGVKSIGFFNWGVGYYDSAPTVDNGYYVDIELDYICLSLAGNYTLALDPANTAFVIEGGAVYNADKTVIYTIIDRTIAEFTLPATVVELAFEPGNYQQARTPYLQSFLVESGNPVFTSQNGVLYRGEDMLCKPILNTGN